MIPAESSFRSARCKNLEPSKWFLVLLLAAGCFFPLAGFLTSAYSAALPVSTEYQVKAAFLVKFIKYLQWDFETSAAKSAEITVGVLGETPLWDALQTYEGKKVANRSLHFRKLTGTGDMAGCRIVYFSVSERRNLPQLLEHAAKNRIVTVSDIKRFAHEGGVIGFIPRGENIKFEINTRSAQAAGVQISSDLLHLAARVIE